MTLLLNHKELKQLKEYAETHRFTIQDIRSVQNGRQIRAGDRIITSDYKIVFTIDETLSFKWVRHLSLSLFNVDLNDAMLKEVCGYLGFEDFNKCKIERDGFHKNATQVFEYI